jgi:hypothetical protein
MFPIGAVLFPRGVVPLQVFEPRYKALVADIAETDNRFGVVLIERGSDVGGGDVRTSVGTIAEVVQRADLDDGRILLINVGLERIRVTRWLEDDPYPVADVEPYLDESISDGLGPAIDAAFATRRRLMALAVEMGADASGLRVDMPEDPIAAAWELCAVSPLGPLDQQRLLEMTDPIVRTKTLEFLLTEQLADLERAMRGGTEST